MEKINFKLTILFALSLATQLLMEDMDAEVRMEGVSQEWRRETKFGLGEINKNLDKALASFGKARMAYERFIEPSRDKCFRDKETKKFNAQVYDDAQKDANEVLRLVMLYCEKCFQNFDNVNAVFKHLHSLEGMGIFTDADIERYRM